MQSARGKYLLFADADGVTKFSDYDKLELSMKHLANGEFLIRNFCFKITYLVNY